MAVVLGMACLALAHLCAAADGVAFDTIRIKARDLPGVTGHVQGMCVSDDAIFLSTHNAVVKADWSGKVLGLCRFASHMGDLAFHDGRIYCTWSRTQGGKKEPVILVLDADLKEVTRKTIPDVPGCDGIAVMDGRVYFGVGRMIKEPHRVNTVGMLDMDLNVKGFKDVDYGVETNFGVQNMCILNGKIYAFFYTHLGGKKGAPLKCCILDCRTNEKSYLTFPVDTVSEDGRLATNFSYERLNVLMPGYGYPYCHDGGYLEQKAPAETGLFLIDMASGKRRMLLSLEQLAKESDSPLAALESHFVTHSEFSKDGHYVSFMHRHIGQDYRKRTSRLIVYDLQTGEHFALPTTGMVSHYCWNNRNQIVCYCSVAEGDAHVLFDIPSGKYRPVLLNKLNQDGHQSMVNDSIFVTDTYPDARRMATLWAVDMEHDVRTELAYLHSPKQFQTQDEHRHIACDLHPRVSPDGHYVCFDSVHTGKRALCVMPLVLK